MKQWFKELYHRALPRRGQTIFQEPQALRANPTARLDMTFDYVICHYLMHTTRVPYFVQVGAFDGISGDPLYPYVMRGLIKGCAVEPQLDAFEQLQANYAQIDGIHLKRAAISERTGEATLYRIRPGTVGPEWLYQLASFRRDVLLKHSSYHPDLESAIVTETVPAITFDDLIAEFGAEPDIVVIDTEGFDFEIIKLLNVTLRRPRIILYESKHLSTADQNACVELLLDVGYRAAVVNVDTVAYLPEHPIT